MSPEQLGAREPWGLKQELATVRLVLSASKVNYEHLHFNIS